MAKEYVISLRCFDCKILYRIVRCDPNTVVGPFSYCPICGSTKVSAFQDSDEDYWEVLGKEYGFDAEIMEAMYKLWNPHEFLKFHDFVLSIKKEAIEEKGSRDVSSV